MQCNYRKCLIEKNDNCKMYDWYWKYIYHVQQKTNIVKDIMFYYSVIFFFTVAILVTKNIWTAKYSKLSWQYKTAYKN